MTYTYPELVLFCLIYSFLGWCVEVCALSLRERHFCNRGVLNAPFCFAYGISMALLVVMLPTFTGHWITQAVMCIVVTATVRFISGGITRRLFGTELWNYHRQNLFGGEMKEVTLSVIIAGAHLAAVYLIHPFLFLLVELIPPLAVNIICLASLGVIALDFVSVLVCSSRGRKNPGLLRSEEQIQKGTAAIGGRITQKIWKRLRKAYPGMTDQGSGAARGYVFAQGICLDKLLWVFLICALLGDIIETFFVRGTAGVWMSRSSVIYGPFSIVWGAGAVLLTMVLVRLKDKGDIYIFLGGFFLGGTYEYLCSVFTEVFFGTTFWDYSDMPFNIGGRTNLLFCFFWGLLGVVWVRGLYPPISKLVEKIPPRIGKLLTWTLMLLMACDAAISVMAMVRYTQRAEDISAGSQVERMLDENYPDQLVERVWPNMRVMVEGEGAQETIG